MTSRTCLAAALALALAALAGCTSSSTTTGVALLAEPSSVAVFRGVTLKSGRDDGAAYPYRPYIAVANTGGNDISILDGTDDTLVQAPAPTRGLVYSAPGRPLLVAAADLGDRKPDLLVVVTAGDLPWLGGTQLRVVKTWGADGTLVERTDGAPAVDFGADVLALLALPFEPTADVTTSPPSVKLVAALAGERIATVTFRRAPGSAPTAIDVDAAQATVTVSPPLGFQPLQLAAIPGERTRVFAASTETLPGGVQGVAEIAVSGVPAFTAALNAHAPTRLVAAGRLAEVDAGATALDASAFTDLTPHDRVWAVLDESGCGLSAAIGCGLVAIDATTRDLVPDPTPATSVQNMQAPFRAPIPIAYPLALAASGPPALPPSATEPQFAGTFMRVASTVATWTTTGVAGVASSDGTMTYVDLARWNVPSTQTVYGYVKAKVTSTRPAGTAGSQWLTLADPSTNDTLAHSDAARLAAAVTVTGGYTPNDHWILAREGALPGLTTRRAEVYADGSFALQVTGSGTPEEVVRLWDPTLGVQAGDVVVIEPTGLGTCRTFEARIAAVLPPAAAAGAVPARPGGYVTLDYRPPTVPEWKPAWDRCLDAMKATAGTAGISFLATVRAGDYVLLRGNGAAQVHVGRPQLGQRFEVAWQDETALAAACPLPPSVRWQSAWSDAPPTCDAACRAGCELLQRVRLARRIGYVTEPPPVAKPVPLTGPALAFTLKVAEPGVQVPRDLALDLETFDGRAPYRVAPSAGYPVDPRAMTVFDRSPWVAPAGPRFLVPYAGGVLMDSTPTLATDGTTTIH